MAAPSYKSSIVWGSILDVDKTHKGKIGLYIKTKNTNTQTTVTTEIWFQSMYWTLDTSNTLKADWDSTKATTSQGSVTIDNLVEGVTDSGSGWSDKTMVLIKTMTKTYDRTKNAVTKDFAASLTGISGITGTMSVTGKFTIPALATYVIDYDGNGGSNVPESQTGSYGASVTLATKIPVKSGFAFLGWSTTKNSTEAEYQPGGTYTGTASVTLYAVWDESSNCHVKVDGVYKAGMMYVKDSGKYKLCQIYSKQNGVYR